MTDQAARLGELIRVKNTEIDHHLESEELLVGHIMLDDRIMPVAFTLRELDRPVARAEKNREDLSVLAVNPPDWDDIAALKSEVAELRVERKALLERGLLQRIFNTVPTIGVVETESLINQE